MNDDSWHKQRANLDDIRNMRIYIRDKATDWDVDAPVIYDLMMAATEAVTNIILHGYQGRPGSIDISIKNEGNEIVIFIQDEAPPFDPSNASLPDITLPLEKRPIGGEGILLMQACIDQIIHELLPQGGNKLTLIKRYIIRTLDPEV